MRVEGPGTAGDVSTARIEPVRPLAVDAVREKQQPERTGEETKPRSGRNVEGAGQKRAKEPVDLETAVEIANKAVEISNYNLQFRIHKESGRVQVKVIDAETQEVIREIPPEKMLEISASIMEMLEKFQKMVGVLVDELV